MDDDDDRLSASSVRQQCASPRHRARDPQHRAAALVDAMLGAMRHDETRRGEGRPRLLLVDDEPMILAALQRVLVDGHEVEMVSDPAQAMARLAAGERYDLVLCDMVMGPLTGRDVLAAALRADHPAHRFVFVTGGARDEADADFLRHWPYGLVRKPCSADEVLEAVAAALGERV